MSYINLGGLVEGSVGMNVVVEDDDAHHHSHTEQQSVLAVKPAGVVTEGETTHMLDSVCVCVCDG